MKPFKRYRGKKIDSKDPNYAKARWNYEFRIKGKRYSGSCPEARTQDQALAHVEAVRAELFRTRYRGRAKDMAFSKFVDDFYLPHSRDEKATYGDDVTKARELKGIFRDTPIQSISRAECKRAKRIIARTPTPQGTPRTIATVNRYMACLSAILSLAVAEDLIEANPCLRLTADKEHNERSRTLTADEHDRLLAVMVGDLAYMRPPYVISMQTGMRLGTMLRVRVEHVNLSDEVRRVLVQRNPEPLPPDCLLVPYRPRSKDKFTRIVPLNNHSRAVFAELVKDRSADERVFTFDANGVSERRITTGLTEVCARAGIPKGNSVADGIVWHDLRRTFITRLRDQGVHQWDIQYLAGHVNKSVTVKNYAQENIGNLRRAINTLAGPWGNVIRFERRAG